MGDFFVVTSIVDVSCNVLLISLLNVTEDEINGASECHANELIDYDYILIIIL